MDKLILKKPSEKLKQKLDDVVKRIRNCAILVDEVIALGKEEGFSEKQIGRMLREKLQQLDYDSRSIRRALPASIKDQSKIRKDYLCRSDDNGNDNVDEDILSSSESRNNFDEKRQTKLSEMVKELQAKIVTLKEQLSEEQIKNDLYKIELSQLQDVHGDVKILIIHPDQFPPEYDQVFESQGDAFLVEFKGTEVLDISMISIQEENDQFTD